MARLILTVHFGSIELPLKEFELTMSLKCVPYVVFLLKIAWHCDAHHTMYIYTYHKLTFIIEDSLQLAILRKQLLKSGEKQCICIFAVLNLAHKHVQLSEFCSDFNSETSSELLSLRSAIIYFLFFLAKKYNRKKKNGKKKWKWLKRKNFFGWNFFFEKNIF